MSAAARAVGKLVTSPGLRALRRKLAALPRKLSDTRATVHYFHQADDPYSHLMLQVLPALKKQYRIRLELHLVPPPTDAAAPDRERLQAWSRRDAAQIADQIAALPGLEFTDSLQQPDAAILMRANRCLAQAFSSNNLAQALQISRALWRNDTGALQNLAAAPEGRVNMVLAKAAALRKKKGHYLGATLYFESEWFWGVDRLWYLENRLRDEGLALQEDTDWLARLPQLEMRQLPATGKTATLHFFCSLRSPYTYLAVERAIKLARHYGVTLQLRFVLPMVMRGLAVPLEKRLYIVRDTKREAETLGLPFGDMADPVGRPTKRGLAVLHQAIQTGKGEEFLLSFMRGVWSEGIDAGTDKGLSIIAERAGLDAFFVSAALADTSWQAVANANRTEMLGAGLWGVPSFRIDQGAAVWGQDRLVLLELDLIEALSA